MSVAASKLRLARLAQEIERYESERAELRKAGPTEVVNQHGVYSVCKTAEERSQRDCEKSKRYRAKAYAADPDFYKKLNKKYAADQQAWRDNNPEKVKATRERQLAKGYFKDYYTMTTNTRGSKNHAWRATAHGRAVSLVCDAKNRAKKKGVCFALTAADIEAKIAAGVCAVTGLPLDLASTPRERSPFVPSLDRIDPSIGYTPQNVQVVVWIYNAAKGDWSHDAVLKLARALVKPTALAPWAPHIPIFPPVERVLS